MTDPLISQQLSNYRVERIIGRGGMATVYYGWDVSLERPVAIKVVDARFRENPAYAQRFIQEARTVATWRHDNILQVFYAGQENDLSYFVMEFVDGPDLGQVMRQYVDDGELMPQEDVLRLGSAIADALDYAHGREVVHRDVKPSNVMIAKNGRIVLADFGLALNVQQGSIGEIFGTPHYIAPEQARNSAMAVSQSDLYSLGVILYEMLTGVVPFDDPSPTSLALQHITQPPPNPREINPRLNEATEAVLLKALNKQPTDRYETGAQLMAALSDALSEPATAVIDSSSDLPPLPTGVAAPAMSQTSVAERVSFFLPPPPASAQSTPAQATPPLPPQATAKVEPSNISAPPAFHPARPASSAPDTAPKKQPWGLIAIGAIVVLIIVYFVGTRLMGRDEETALLPTVTSEAALVVPPESEPTAEEKVVVATETAVSITVTPLPTDAPVVDIPPTEVLPTETAVVATESTQPPTETQPEAAATVLYPDGHRLELLYNPSSFYVFNASPDPVRLSSLKFEALNENSQSVGYSFDGYRWSQFYSFVADNGCARLEISKMSNYLRPGKCREYNSTITPPEGDPENFWIEQANTTQFRVLWEDQEIARCPVPGDFCEVFAP